MNPLETDDAVWLNKISNAAFKTNEIYSNYVGNKKKILPWIAKCMLKEGVLHYPQFIDLFGGSGNCSYFFNQLGKTGCINELLYFSHNMHKIMFSGHKELVTPIHPSNLVPPYVTFNKYENISLADTAKKKMVSAKKVRDLLGDEDIASVHDVETVSIDVDFYSENGIFNNFWTVVRPFVGRNLTAKEAFESCCYLTHAILNGEDEYNIDKVLVKCIQGDSVGFIKEKKYEAFIDPSQTFIYLDPPYGADNSNNKYYKIYDLMECLSYAFYKINNKYKENKSLGIEPQIWKYVDDIPNLSSNIDKLEHIKLYGSRFAGSVRFKDSFFELLDALKSSDLPVWIFSFGADSSFVPGDEIACIVQDYCHHVAVYSMSYDYSYRKKKSENNKSMSGMTIGVDTDTEAGKKTTTDSEVLYICKR